MSVKSVNEISSETCSWVAELEGDGIWRIDASNPIRLLVCVEKLLNKGQVLCRNGLEVINHPAAVSETLKAYRA